MSELINKLRILEANFNLGTDATARLFQELFPSETFASALLKSKYWGTPLDSFSLVDANRTISVMFCLLGPVPVKLSGTFRVFHSPDEKFTAALAYYGGNLNFYLYCADECFGYEPIKGIWYGLSFCVSEEGREWFKLLITLLNQGVR